MYKKISHNIVEEHFEHPTALPVGMFNNANSKPMKYGNNKYTLFWNTFITLNTDLRSYIKSELIDSADNTFNWTQLNSTINDFKSISIPSYNQQNNQIIVNYLAGYVNGIKEIVILVKAGQDYTVQQALALTNLISLSRLLTTTNPVFYRPVVNFEESITNYNVQVVAEIVARHAQDWAADYAAARLALATISSFIQDPHYSNE